MGPYLLVILIFRQSRNEDNKIKGARFSNIFHEVLSYDFNLSNHLFNSLFTEDKIMRVELTTSNDENC